MKYHDGSEIRLGDIVSIPTPVGDREARVVILGETEEHLDVDHDFVDWVLRDKIMAKTSIFLEWTGANPFAHSDPGLAPVGNYMSTTVDEHVRFHSRATA